MKSEVAVKLDKKSLLKVLIATFLWTALAVVAYFSFILLGIGNTAFIYEGV